MKRFKELFLKLFSPGITLTVVFCVVSSALLVYVFVNKLEQTAVAYVSYVVSAYTLVTVSLKIPKIIKFCKRILYLLFLQYQVIAKLLHSPVIIIQVCLHSKRVQRQLIAILWSLMMLMVRTSKMVRSKASRSELSPSR